MWWIAMAFTVLHWLGAGFAANQTRDKDTQARLMAVGALCVIAFAILVR